MAITDMYGLRNVISRVFTDKYFHISAKKGGFSIGKSTLFYSQITSDPKRGFAFHLGWKIYSCKFYFYSHQCI